jgi:hypothetical protein
VQIDVETCFLVGAPRSGTTWVQRLLQSHELICGGEESHFFNLICPVMHNARTMGNTNERPIGPLAYISEEELTDGMRHLWMAIFSRLYDENPGVRIHLEKTPFHVFCLDEIFKTLPRSKVIFLTRDSRAVASSLIAAGKSWGKGWAPETAKEAAIEWHRHVKAMITWAGQNPDKQVLWIKYEDALRDQRGTLELLLKFILPKDVSLNIDATLTAYEKARTAQSDPKGFARLRGAGGWKEDLSIRQKLTVWRYTRKLMKEIGYDITPFA